MGGNGFCEEELVERKIIETDDVGRLKKIFMFSFILSTFVLMSPLKGVLSTRAVS